MNARQRKKASLGCYRHRRYTSPPKPVGNAGMPTTPAAFLDAIGMRGQWGESCASSPSWDGLPMFYARDSTSGLDVCEPIIDGDRDGAITRAMARLQDSVQMWLNRHQIRRGRIE